MDNIKIVRSPHPKENAGIFSLVTHSWIFSLLGKGWKHKIGTEDLYRNLTEHSSKLLGLTLERHWINELRRAKDGKKVGKASLVRSLARMFGFPMLMYALLYGFSRIVVNIVIIYFVQNVLKNISDENPTDYIINSIGLTLSIFVNTVTTHLSVEGLFDCAVQAKVAISSLIYHKVLFTKITTLGELSSGHVVNMITNDVSRFERAFYLSQSIWIGLIEIIAVGFLLWKEIQWVIFIGLLVIVVIILMQCWLSKMQGTIRNAIAKITDQRVKIMNEMISGIEVIKMYTWEKPFAKLVSLIRKKEINEIKKYMYIVAIARSCNIFQSKLIIYICILAFVTLGNRISITIEFLSSGCTEENEGKFVYSNHVVDDDDDDNESGRNPVHDEHVVMIKNVSAKWHPKSDIETLGNISVSVKRGDFLAVIGTVGAGKSSLLSLILKDLSPTSGSVIVSGSVSYASQEPWIFIGSIRQNILFGGEMDTKRYQRVINVCSLEKDIEQFPNGDETMIGERGVLLSGGQRARINLARSIYKNADLYLLDDPLSAVDPHVGNCIYEQCIQGYLKDKTRILITHQLQYLTDVKDIIVLEKGKITMKGSYHDLKTASEQFSSILKYFEKEESERIQSLHKSIDEIEYKSSTHNTNKLPIEGKKSMNLAKTKNSIKYINSYQAFMSNVGHKCFLFLVFLMILFNYLICLAVDSFTAVWVNHEDYVNLCVNHSVVQSSKCLTPEPSYVNKSQVWYITVYTVLVILTIVSSVAMMVILVDACLKVSINLHNKIFSVISTAKMHFFNTNPSGGILNRFSKDLFIVDEMIPQTLVDVMECSLACCGTFVIVAYVNPWLLIPTLILGYICIMVSQFFLRTLRKIKKLEIITGNPVLSHLNATLQGLTTIKAFHAQSIVETEYYNYQDVNSTAMYLNLSIARSFAFYLDILGLIYMAFVTSSFLYLKDISEGGMGLALSQAILIMGILQWVLRQLAELDNHMLSVSHIIEYQDVPKESNLEASALSNEEWPSRGNLEFKNMFLKYEANGSTILKNLNFIIKSQEKVGIVGRTGAGKSSIIAALFRLAENEGQIFIDGIDIGTLPLKELRSKISIIPQEPFLFSGTIRDNLDPFDEYSDNVIWDALDEVELKKPLSELNDGLNSRVSEGGSNFSVGERQLFCLARAIIRNNKILLMDEATANVDPQTDSLIQLTIREKFKHCTVLTIAHRLNSVMDSDKILVMDVGRCVEFDHPHKLLQKEEGLFYKMVQKTGKTMSEDLHKTALQNYEKTSTSL